MSTTLGIKVDEVTRERLATLAEGLDRTPHWILKAALNEYLDREENHLREQREDLARWEHFSLTGEAVSGADADAWLSRLEAGEDVPCPW